jgi:hypothetical protein
LFPFHMQKQIILLDFHLTEVSDNSRCKEYICKYLRNPHFCSISKIKRWGGEYCIKTYLATPRPLLCHLSGNATPSVMSLIWQRHALCYVTYLATPSLRKNEDFGDIYICILYIVNYCLLPLDENQAIWFVFAKEMETSR